MSPEKPPQHARPGHPSLQPPGSEPSYAERARTLIDLVKVGTLSTISRRHPGWPFGSVMPYGLDPEGQPTFLISSMAMHTKNLIDDPRASLLATEPGVASDPLGAGRVTLMGKIKRTPPEALERVKQNYLSRHSNASFWVDFGDFAFFQLEVTDLYFVGGFGVMGWVSAVDYRSAEVDPLAQDAPGIIEHMNDDHVDAMLKLARGIADVDGDEARMTTVDRLGFHLRVKTGQGMRGLRIPFDRECRTSQEVRRVLVEMVKKQKPLDS